MDSVADAAMKLLINMGALGALSAFLTWLLFQAWSPAGENWRRLISNTMPIAIVLVLTPLGAWREWFDYTDDLLFNALIGAVAVGWGKQWIYNGGKAAEVVVNKVQGEPNEPGV